MQVKLNYDALNWRRIGNRVEEAETLQGRYTIEFFWEPPHGFKGPIAILTKPCGRDIYLTLERDACRAHSIAAQDYEKVIEKHSMVGRVF